jgi:proteasome assembly chaperone (PAC2) family protein
VLIAAFEGWNDAGDGASLAARFLARQWGARQFATVDAEEFFDFTSTRPEVRLDADRQREIVWPATELLAAPIPGSDRDAVLLIGTEPQLRWRTFCRQITDVSSELGVQLVISLGALLADVPHTRPVSVVGSATSPGLVSELGLQQSRYEGPTGITGVLTTACAAAGLPAATLWAAVPTYVPSAPSPKAALALVQRCSELLGTRVVTSELEIAAAEYVRQLDSLVAADDDTAEYVARLEAAADEPTVDDDDDEDDEAGILTDPADVDPERFIEDVERFLRDQD